MGYGEVFILLIVLGICGIAAIDLVEQAFDDRRKK
jgi:hypothetical protein